MSFNSGEEIVGEYLRLNGFLLIRDFTIHFIDRNPSDIDFIGVRMPYSVECCIHENGQLSTLIFEEDNVNLDFLSSECIIFLVSEVTLSNKKKEIEKRIGYLRNHVRLEYALRRLGVTSTDETLELIKGNEVQINSTFKAKLSRILFLYNDELVEKYQKDNPDIKILSLKHARDFIKQRAKYDIKSRAPNLLPPYIQLAIRNLEF
jgi:hypothetical protein